MRLSPYSRLIPAQAYMQEDIPFPPGGKPCTSSHALNHVFSQRDPKQVQFQIQIRQKFRGSQSGRDPLSIKAGVTSYFWMRAAFLLAHCCVYLSMFMVLSITHIVIPCYVSNSHTAESKEAYLVIPVIINDILIHVLMYVIYC